MTKLTNEQCDNLMISQGLARYDAQIAKSHESGTLTNSPAANHLLTEAVERMSEAVKAMIKKSARTTGRKSISVKYLSQFKPDVVALVACRTVLDRVSEDISYLTVANAVARNLDDELMLAHIQRESRQQYQEIRKMASRAGGLERKRKVLRGLAAQISEDWVCLTRRERYTVGTVLIETMFDHTGLLAQNTTRTSTRSGGTKTTIVLSPSPATIAWLYRSEEAHRALYPMLLPTTYVPFDWEDQWSGGYSTNIYMRQPLFVVRPNVLDSLTPEAMPHVYRAVNALQRTPWRINRNVLALAAHYFEEGVAVAGLPSCEESDLPERTWPEGTEPHWSELREWKRIASRVYKENGTLPGKRAKTARTLFVARTYQHQDFYYPHKVDFRGRMYPIPTFLSPQGDDLSKGLLEFGAGRCLLASDTEAVAWLMIHGANCWGEDKISFGRRVRWVDENEKMIRAIARDPIATSQWTDADEPWQFLAFCLEYDAMLDEHAAGREFITRLPVGMDGSNNGLQLYSLALRDPVGAKATNVSPSEEPQDAYREVADDLYARLVLDSESLDEEKRGMALGWLGFFGKEVPREATKRAVMTLPYGATKFSAREYVEDWYEGELGERGLKDDRPFNTTFIHTRYLTNLLWEAIHSVVVGARAAMSWLQQVADACTEAGVPAEWRSPSGFFVSQESNRTEGILIQTKVGDRLVKRRGKIPTNVLSKRAMRNGIAPNFVHALDAAVLALTVNTSVKKGIVDFAMVHDCYATHCTEASTLAATLRHVVATIFTGDVLAEFKETIEAQLNIELPSLPPYGDLDPNVVRSSLYFFA